MNRYFLAATKAFKPGFHLTGFLFKSLLLLLVSVSSLGNLNAQTVFKQKLGSLTIANGPLTTPQVVTMFHGGAATPLTVTYSLSEQQFGPGMPDGVLEGIASNFGVNFGSTNTTGNSPLSPFPRNSLMNAAGSATNAMFTACATCTGGMDVAADYAVSIAPVTDALITDDGSTFTAGTNRYDLNARVRYADITLTFSQPVTNPVLHLVGMGGSTSSSIDGFDQMQGYSTEFDLLTAGYTISELNGSTYFDVTANTISNTAPLKGNSSVGNNGGVAGSPTRYGASGSVLITGSNITTLTFRIYLKGDGGWVSGGATQAVWAKDASPAPTVSNDVFLMSVTVPAGYMYVQKKTLDETSSIDFPFTLSNGATTIANFNLNDNPTQIPLQDIGVSQNGRVWAVGSNNILYYRDLGVSSWTSTGVTNAIRVDGGAGNTAYVVTNAGSATTGTVLYYDGSVAAGSAIYTGTNATDVGSAWNNQPYIIANSGAIYQYSGSGTGTAGSASWPQIGATTDNKRIDGNPANGNAVVAKTTNSVSSITSAGVSANFGFGVVTTIDDVAVTASGQIFASWGATNRYIYKYLGTPTITTWSPQETTSRNYVDAITGGLGGQVLGIHISVSLSQNIYTRTFDGTNILWLNDERVRLTPTSTGNSILIPVPAETPYTLTEAVPAGWDLQHLTVYDPTSNSSTTLSSNFATLNVATGEVVSVVFENGLVSPVAMTTNCATSYLENFGDVATKGTYGPALAGQTSYHYRNTTQATLANDYKIVSNANLLFGGAANLPDHTVGDVNGHMMAVDVNNEPDAFFRRRFTGIIPNATYNFSAWLANINAGAPIKPNVTFDVIDPTTYAILATYNTGDITLNAVWTQYGFNFTTTSTTIDLVIRNNGNGGQGNDLALDDISFALVPGAAPISTVANTGCGTSGSITVTSPVGASYEYSINGTTWQQHPSTSFSNLAPGTYTVYARYIGTTNCIVSKNEFVAATICGKIWNDVNGDAINNTENPITSGVWVNLVDPVTHLVIQSVQVDALGNYSFTGLLQNTTYEIILTDAVKGAGTSLTSATIPAEYGATGTNLSGTANTSDTDGKITVSTGAGGLIEQNFGLEKLPESAFNQQPDVGNPGGFNSFPVPAGAFQTNNVGTTPSTGDYDGGTVTDIRVTSFPAGANSITIGSGVTAVTYITIGGTCPPATTCTPWPAGGVIVPYTNGTGPSVPISVDPLEGNTDVVINFAAIDNAGKEDPSSGSVTIPFKTIAVSGSVWNDANGNLVQDGTEAVINGTNTGGGTVTGEVLYANLLDANGKVIATVPVQIDGTYSFPNVPQSATGLTIQLSTNQGTVGLDKPLTDIPDGWVNTGENKNGQGGASDVTANGEIILNTGTTPITQQNFGIERLPDSAPKTQLVPYPTGGVIPATTVTTSVTGSDPEDGPLGNGNTIEITTLPANAIMLYNGVAVTVGQQITGFTPGSLSFTNITNGSVQVLFQYAFLDAAGQKDPIPANYLLTWAHIAPLPVKLESFTAKASSCNDVVLNWRVSDAVNFSHFEMERSLNGNSFQASGIIFYDASLTTYMMKESNLAAGQYQYRLKMVDVDGETKYSPVAFVRLDCNLKQILIYPNPVLDKLTINGLRNNEQVNVYSMNGALMISKKAARYQEEIDMSLYTAGAYRVVIRNAEGLLLHSATIIKPGR